jgi:signal transduction histidine kinase
MMDHTIQKPDASQILVVDDTPANLKLITEILASHGYRVRAAPSGRLALKTVDVELPDLILLDVKMPDMDGYEVCRRLKSEERSRMIPVIFISALTDTEDKIQGFQAGGVDYITKPFQAEEVHARVSTHLKLHFYQDALEEKNRQLQSSYRRLQELENLRDQLTHMIVHDMRNLLTGISSSMQLLRDNCDGALDEKYAIYLHAALISVNNLTTMTSNLLDISKMEAREMKLNLTECDLTGLMGEAMEKIGAIRDSRDIRFNAPQHVDRVVADRDILLRVIINLLDNAIKFTAADGVISVGVEPKGEGVLFSIRDNGPGIPARYHEKIFEKFGQVEIRQSARQYSTGLGLAFCKLAVEAHHGKIWVESEAGAGSAFFFEIPGSGSTITPSDTADPVLP